MKLKRKKAIKSKTKIANILVLQKKNIIETKRVIIQVRVQRPKGKRKEKPPWYQKNNP